MGPQVGWLLLKQPAKDWHVAIVVGSLVTNLSLPCGEDWPVTVGGPMLVPGEEQVSPVR